MASPFLYFAHQALSPAELSAARLDGHLMELGEGYVPADTVETTLLRADSLRSIAGERLAASFLSAAWVWGALETPPAQPSFSRATKRRTTIAPGERGILRDIALERSDLIRVGEIWVTSPERTVYDLARSAEPEEYGIVNALVSEQNIDRTAILDRLRSHGRLPGSRRAIALLSESADRTT